MIIFCMECRCRKLMRANPDKKPYMFFSSLRCFNDLAIDPVLIIIDNPTDDICIRCLVIIFLYFTIVI